MARQVTGSAASYLIVDTGTALAFPYTISARLKRTPGSIAGLAMVYGQVNGAGAWDQDSIADIAAAQSASGASFAGTALATTIVDSTWYLAVAVFTSNTDRRVYVDGSVLTAADSTFVPARFITSKLITVGGIFTQNAPGLHPAVTWNGHVADVALWDTALTATDVDALAAGRPGDVKPGNLKAWYKLGEDNDLSSSWGTYGPMTVVGSVPVTADPVYPTMGVGDIKTVNALPVTSIKTFDSIPRASVKKFNTLSMGGAPFSPADIAGLRSWYKSDNGIWTNSSASFIGGNLEMLQMASNATITLGNFPWTMGGWFNQYGQYHAADLLMSKRGATSVEYQFHLGGGNVTFLAFNGTGYPGPALPYTGGTWVFVVGSYDGAGNLSLQVNNGTPLSTVLGTPAVGTSSLGFGGDISSPGTYDYNGALQNWFIFDRALDSTERSFLWNGGNGRHYKELSLGFKTGLRVWWPFDEKSGSRIDAHNGNTLTDVNTVANNAGKVLNPARNNTPVYKWDDWGPAGLHVLQSDLTKQPLYQTGVQNGQAAVVFDPSATQWLQSASVPLASLPVGASDGDSWFALASTGPSVIYCIWNDGTGSTTYELAYSGGNWIYDHGVIASARIYAAGTGAFALMENYRSGGAMELRRNDATIQTGAPGSVLGAGPAPFQFSNPGSGWCGPISEAILYNVGLSAGDRAALRNYFNMKYGLGF